MTSVVCFVFVAAIFNCFGVAIETSVIDGPFERSGRLRETVSLVAGALLGVAAVRAGRDRNSLRVSPVRLGRARELQGRGAGGGCAARV
jgi:hypothetical protein